MPLEITQGQPTLLIRREAFERSGLTRQALDERFTLTADEFRVESDLITIGPLPNDEMLRELIEAFEAIGAVYYDDFFELSGNWPEWLRLYGRADPR
jgi:hypothetical protein